MVSDEYRRAEFMIDRRRAVENIRICCGDHASRWSLIQSCISLAQVCDIWDLRLSRVLTNTTEKAY